MSSALLQATAEEFSARYRALAPSLPGPGEVRRRAASWFAETGLPDTREEAWRFTSLRPLAGIVFGRAGDRTDGVEGLLARIPPTEAPAIVFVEGRMRADLSRLPAAGERGLTVESFAAAPASIGLAAGIGEPVVALNTMLAEDGARIALAPASDAGTLLLVSLATGERGHPPALHPRHQLHLGAGARLTLIEIFTGTGDYLDNPVLEVSLAEGATLLHLSLQDESRSAFHLGSRHLSLGRNSAYNGFALVRGGRLARSELIAKIEGTGASFAFHAAQMLTDDQVADITTVVRHAAPGAASRQTVRNVLTGHAHGIFQGRIEVAREAQKTDGYQMNQALLLSDTAQINSKPELEIFADDVKCSHGATVGALDQDQLFYLQSRGVPKPEAREILVGAFLSEMLEAIPDDWGRRLLEREVKSWRQDRPL